MTRPFSLIFKALPCLCALLLALSSCATPYPDLTERLERESASLQSEWQRGQTDEQVEQTRGQTDGQENQAPGQAGSQEEAAAKKSSYKIISPEDGDTVTIRWALLRRVGLDYENLCVALNRYLEKEEAAYRVELVIFQFGDADFPVGGGSAYAAALIENASVLGIDLMNLGYSFGADDSMPVEFFLAQDLLMPIDESLVCWPDEMRYKGKIYGVGNPAPPTPIGIFIDGRLADDVFSGVAPEGAVNGQQSEMSAVEWLESNAEQIRQKPAMLLQIDPRRLLGQRLYPREALASRLLLLLLNDEGLVTFPWRHPSYAALQDLLAPFVANAALDFASYETMLREYPFRIGHRDSFRESSQNAGSDLKKADDRFIPWIFDYDDANYSLSMENSIYTHTQRLEQAMDFLMRLDHDPDLVAVIIKTSMETSTSALLGIRLCNELLLEEDPSLSLRPERDKEEIGFFWRSAAVEEELAQIRRLLDEDEHAALALKQILQFRDADGKYAEILEAKLREAGVERVMEDLQTQYDLFLAEKQERIHGGKP